jgi:hypothetical protein
MYPGARGENDLRRCQSWMRQLKKRLRERDDCSQVSREKNRATCRRPSTSLNGSEDIPSEQEITMKAKQQLRKRVTTTIAESFEDVDPKTARDDEEDDFDEDAENDGGDEEEDEAPTKRRRKPR